MLNVCYAGTLILSLKRKKLSRSFWNEIREQWEKIIPDKLIVFKWYSVKALIKMLF